MKIKDAEPIDTIEKIKSILKENNIETEEQWLETGIPYCFALRVTLKGTTFGTNGKGLTKDLALASGYGEMMERLQLGFIGKIDLQKDASVSPFDVVSEKIAAKELFHRNKKWYELFASRLKFFTGETIESEQILMQYADKEGNAFVTPFYCINSNTKEFLPTKLCKNIYTSNGCAAGNTTEEAIVQAISEIVERHNETQIVMNNMTPPDVPEQALKKCTEAYSVISYLRDKGFKVNIKDCSLETKFPVVSVCIVDSKTGKYHTHFGAHPKFEVALERALTESFQGRNIRNISEIEDFCFSKDGFNVKNLLNELLYGVAEKNHTFFVGTPSYKYNEKVGFAGSNNKDWLKECIEYFNTLGYDILIRDSSCLGFDTYQVIIPGYSEVFCQRFSQKTNEIYYYEKAVKTLRNPSEASVSEKLGLLMSLVRHNRGFVRESGLHVNLTQEEESYFMAATLSYIYYGMKKYDETIKYINVMLQSGFTENIEFLLCIKRYISLLLNETDTEEIKNTLCYFHNKESVNRLYECIESNTNPIEEFTLHCDMKCSKNCMLKDKCCNKKLSDILNIILEKSLKVDSNKIVDFFTLMR